MVDTVAARGEREARRGRREVRNARAGKRTGSWSVAAGACSRDGGRGAADSCQYRQYKYKLVAARRKEGYRESKKRLRSKLENYFQASLRSRSVRYAAKGSHNITNLLVKYHTGLSRSGLTGTRNKGRVGEWTHLKTGPVMARDLRSFGQSKKKWRRNLRR